MQTKIFEYKITVPKTVIDDMNHVNNVMYLQWMQDIAQKHWESKASRQLIQTYAWVVLNHYIEYQNAAFENETLLIQTWLGEYRGARYERHTKIINCSTQKVIITAKTNYCLLYKETLRPTRIPEEIINLYIPN